jgi:hypothetical protein
MAKMTKKQWQWQKANGESVKRKLNESESVAS